MKKNKEIKKDLVNVDIGNLFGNSDKSLLSKYRKNDILNDNIKNIFGISDEHQMYDPLDGPLSELVRTEHKIPLNKYNNALHSSISFLLILFFLGFILVVKFPNNVEIIIAAYSIIIPLIITYIVTRQAEAFSLEYELKSAMINELQTNFNYLYNNKYVIKQTFCLNNVNSIEELRELAEKGKYIRYSTDGAWQLKTDVFNRLKFKNFNNISHSSLSILDEYNQYITGINSLIKTRQLYIVIHETVDIEHELICKDTIDKFLIKYKEFFEAVNGELVYFKKGTSAKDIINELHSKNLGISEQALENIILDIHRDTYYIIDWNYRT